MLGRHGVSHWIWLYFTVTVTLRLFIHMARCELLRQTRLARLNPQGRPGRRMSLPSFSPSKWSFNQSAFRQLAAHTNSIYQHDYQVKLKIPSLVVRVSRIISQEDRERRQAASLPR